MPRRPTDLLLVGRDEEGLEALGRGLETLGYQIDRVDDLGAIRLAFFQAGGHDAVIVGPGPSVSAIDLVLRDLRSIDPDLHCVVFSGFEREPGTPWVARIRGLHPASASALGAVRRALDHQAG